MWVQLWLRVPARHALTRISASLAHLGAGGYARIIRHALAIFRTSLTDRRTRGAGMMMQIAAALHEVRAGLTDLRAIEHQANVIRLRVLSALLEAVHDRLHAGFMAIDAQFNAILNVLSEI